MLKAKLQNELKQAMLAKDTVKTSVLRMLISAMGYFEIQKGAGYSATDEDATSIIQKGVKERRDSITQFQAAGREDLVQKEQEELRILAIYLPEEMDEETLKSLIDEAVAQTGASTQTDMGRVMGALMPRLKGRADATRVSTLVRDKLTK